MWELKRELAFSVFFFLPSFSTMEYFRLNLRLCQTCVTETAEHTAGWLWFRTSGWSTERLWGITPYFFRVGCCSHPLLNRMWYESWDNVTLVTHRWVSNNHQTGLHRLEGELRQDLNHYCWLDELVLHLGASGRYSPEQKWKLLFWSFEPYDNDSFDLIFDHERVLLAGAWDAQPRLKEWDDSNFMCGHMFRIKWALPHNAISQM